VADVSWRTTRLPPPPPPPAAAAGLNGTHELRAPASQRRAAAGPGAGTVEVEVNECVDCPLGRADLDRDASTPCELCEPGTFGSGGGVYCAPCGEAMYDHLLMRRALYLPATAPQ
jgi:hypothetical protein